MRLNVSVVLDDSVVLEDWFSRQYPEYQGDCEADHHAVLVGPVWSMDHQHKMREKQDKYQVTEGVLSLRYQLELLDSSEIGDWNKY